MIFTREQRITNTLLIHFHSINDVGFLNGKMGIVFYIYLLGKYLRNNKYTEVAEDLLDDVVEQIDETLSLDFEYGITGIGWAIEFLIQNNFIEADSDDILEEIDIRINKELASDTCRNINTLISIGYYYFSRLHYRVNDKENMRVVNLKSYIATVIDEMERHINSGSSHPCLCNLLGELHKLNIVNHKINKMFNTINVDSINYIVPFVPRLSKKEIAEIFNSKESPSLYAGFELEGISDEEKFGLKNGICGIGLQQLLAKHLAAENEILLAQCSRTK